MKKDYIVLNGADATYTNSRLQWNIAPHFFPNLAQDGHEDIYMTLKSITYIADGDADSVAFSSIIDTNLKFSNMNTTSNSSILGIAGCSVRQDSGANYLVSNTTELSANTLKISKFNTIQIGVIYQNGYFDFSVNDMSDYFMAVLEIEYRDNNLKELR
jgi:hypothetical protein